jgi:hypothetical protein
MLHLSTDPNGPVMRGFRKIPGFSVGRESLQLAIQIFLWLERLSFCHEEFFDSFKFFSETWQRIEHLLSQITSQRRPLVLEINESKKHLCRFCLEFFMQQCMSIAKMRCNTIRVRGLLLISFPLCMSSILEGFGHVAWKMPMRRTLSFPQTGHPNKNYAQILSRTSLAPFLADVFSRISVNFTHRPSRSPTRNRLPNFILQIFAAIFWQWKRPFQHFETRRFGLHQLRTSRSYAIFRKRSTAWWNLEISLKLSAKMHFEPRLLPDPQKNLGIAKGEEHDTLLESL